MDNILFADYETTSWTDLPVHGLGRYLADPSTRPTCLTFRLPGMHSADLWEFGQAMPKQITRHIEAGGLFVAHNAPFDFHIWNTTHRRLPQYTHLPEIGIEQTRCSAVRARYNGLPGSLAGACAAMGLPVRKDTEGSAAMLEIARNPDWIVAEHADVFARMYRYALIDTDAMYGLWHATKPIPEHEQKFFEMDMRINARGFGVDVEAAQAMEELKEYAEAMLDYQITVATNGGVLAVTEVARLKEYAKTFGEDIDDAGREALKKIAGREELPDELRAIINLRLDASRAPKKSAAILRAAVGSRIHHGTKFYGALSGRSTASGAGGAQLLNVARPRPGRSAEDCEQYLEAVRRKDTGFLNSPEVGPILAALADAQRPLFCATEDDCTLVGADLSQIEARMAPWLSNNETDLKAYEEGRDLYKITASTMFHIPYDEVSKDQRQVAKVARLALTYGGGDGAFINMAANYGVELPPEEVSDIVWNFRAGAPELELWWSAFEYAALIALDQPGRKVRMPAGRDWCTEIVFVRDEVALRMQLPSGREISYHNARLHLEPGAQVPIAVYDKPEGYVETLDRKILSNNATQGLSRDLFWLIMLDVDRVENIVHHIYDELILEVKRDIAHERLEQLIARMRIAPVWAPRLPLDAAGYVNSRWRKD
jgi:DNA polymerase bacteriophage-type